MEDLAVTLTDLLNESIEIGHRVRTKRFFVLPVLDGQFQELW